MTLADLMRALLRRWPIVVVGLLATLGLAFLATRSEPVYHARTEVVFLAPSSIRNPNELVTNSESLIITAGAVAKRITGADEHLKFGSTLVDPVGAPDTGEHTWIRLFDAGNQWVSNFDDQVLLVDAIGSTPEEAEQRIEAAADRIQAELTAMQQEQGVAPVNEISTRMSPAAPSVTEIEGSRARAGGMTLLLGGLATIGVVVILEVRTRTTADAAQGRAGAASV